MREANRHVCNINRCTRIVADSQQWIVQGKRGAHWEPLFFIGSHKGNLIRRLEDLDRLPDEKGRAAIKKLPFRFSTWADQHLKGQPR